MLPIALLAFALQTPKLDRVVPLGGQVGTTVEVEFVGQDLADFKEVRFDHPGFVWMETTANTGKSIRGKLRLAAGLSLGPHRFQLVTKSGISNGRLFSVTEFPGIAEAEPNDKPAQAQTIELKPQVLHGYLKGLADLDFYRFRAKAGERWLFDVQSIERGGFLESELHLLDSDGKQLAFNDDQDEYLETPRLSFTFPRDGEYLLKIDQYRGPQGVGCGKNCGYALHISQLPIVTGLSPVGTNPGQAYSVTVQGEGLSSVTGAQIRRARGAEHYRLTFPYSIALDGSDRDHTPILATKVRATGNSVQAQFRIPADAKPGLWRLWLETRHGFAEAMSLEIDNDSSAINATLGKMPDRYPVDLRAGEPFHAWTVAAQLGLPAIDTVLELWSSEGKLLAEHDDLMTGQGTVIGNPDSSLYYKPQKSERAFLTVRDRTDRHGPGYSYRLHIASELPSFQLLSEPAQFTVRAGSEGKLSALLIKQPGFEKAVDVWVEGMPSSKAQFRADQHFGPSGDGDNINIPVVHLLVKVPEGTPPGDYPIRLLGRASDSSGPIVEGITTIWIGPDGNRNDTRRPLPAITVHVPEP